MNLFRDSNYINKVLIVDAFNLFFRCFAVVPTMNPDGSHNGGLFGSLNSIRSLVSRFSPDAVVVVFDGPGGSKRRKTIDPEYKASRKIPKRINRTYDFESIEEEQKSLSYQLIRFKSYLSILPVFQVMVDNIEADDTISYITTSLCKDKQVIICSTDKDFLQLIDKDRVVVYRPTTKDTVNEEKLKKFFGDINPVNITLMRCFIGDSSDGISGIKGIGPKTIIRFYGDLLSENKAVDITQVIDIAKQRISENSKYSVIVENEEKLRKNFKLMQLYDTNISLFSKTRIDNSINRKLPLFTPFQLRFNFIKDKLWYQVKNIDNFLTTFSHVNNIAIRWNKLLTNGKECITSSE